MGLDIYVGPLSRYHAGNWKSIVEQAAEAQGIAFQVIRPDAEEAASQDEVTEAVCEWKTAVRDGMRTHNLDIPDWSEDPALPYATDRPGWEGWLGLVMKAAYLRYSDLTPPAHVVTDGSFTKDPAIDRLQGDFNQVSALMQTELWLPGDFPHSFQYQTVTGKPVMVCSTQLLMDTLSNICEMWGRSPEEFLGGEIDQSGPETTLDQAATYGMACVMRLARQAREMGQPIILDY